MKKGKNKLNAAQNELQEVINATNKKIEELGEKSDNLNNELNNIQELFDEIRNIPSEKKSKCEELREVRLNWKNQADRIEADFKKAMTKAVSEGAIGMAAVGVAALGPSAAMGLATTFGVASTGTAISTLSGAAATSAALAWLGGGALTAGGGGMAAGTALITLFGPVGWTIAGVSILSSGLMTWKSLSDKKKIDNIFTLISKRDIKTYELAIVEINERVTRIFEESNLIRDAIINIKNFGTDYEQMTEAQQYELGTYVNLMLSSTQLIINPILGLQPKYSNQDYDQFISENSKRFDEEMCEYYRDIVISLSNLLYKIDLNDNDIKLLFKTFKKNKEFINSFGLKKKFKIDVVYFVEKALAHKYKLISNKSDK